MNFKLLLVLAIAVLLITDSCDCKKRSRKNKVRKGKRKYAKKNKPVYTPPPAPKPKYKTKPAYTPSKPTYKPTKPAYTPSKPAYTPSKPAYTPSKPAYKPTKPAYKVTPAPKYPGKPTTPEYGGGQKYDNKYHHGHHKYHGRNQYKLREKYMKARPRSYKGRGEQREMIYRFERDWKDTNKFRPDKKTPELEKWWHELEYEAVEGRNKHDSSITNRGMRKEYRWLSPEELKDLGEALNALKYTRIPGDARTEFDILVRFHRDSVSPSAHIAAGFLGWHRHYLSLFEAALQRHNPKVNLPYWDPRLEYALPVPADSVFFTHHYIGNADGPVVSGPMAGWEAIPECWKPCGRYLTRNISIINGSDFLYDDADIALYNTATDYTQLTCKPDNGSFSEFRDCKVFSDHALLHVFIGGHVGSITCSPNDIMFWMLHCFVDKLWEEFRENQGEKRTYDYPDSPDPDSPDYYGEPPHAPNAPMYPFDGLTNLDGLSDVYTSRYYYYGDRPSQIIDCTADDDCLSAALWCDVATGRCVAKVKHGGSCEGLPDNACFCDTPLCQNDHCYCEGETTPPPIIGGKPYPSKRSKNPDYNGNPPYQGGQQPPYPNKKSKYPDDNGNPPYQGGQQPPYPNKKSKYPDDNGNPPYQGGHQPPYPNKKSKYPDDNGKPPYNGGQQRPYPNKKSKYPDDSDKPPYQGGSKYPDDDNKYPKGRRPYKQNEDEYYDDSEKCEDDAYYEEPEDGYSDRGDSYDSSSEMVYK